MNPRSLFALVSLLLLCGGCAKPPEDNGLAPLEGEWNVVELNERGVEYDKKQINSMHVKFNNGDYQRDYLLTLELVNVVNGDFSKESAELRKGYHKSRISKLRNYGA